MTLEQACREIGNAHTTECKRGISGTVSTEPPTVLRRYEASATVARPATVGRPAITGWPGSSATTPV